MASLGDRIAAAVVQKFDNLKPRGKPQGREWTVLAGVVAEDLRVMMIFPCFIFGCCCYDSIFLIYTCITVY